MEKSEYILAILAVLAILILMRLDTLWKSLPPNGPHLIRLPNFLTSYECDSLVKAGNKAGLIDSEVSGNTDDKPAYLDTEARKSKQTWFATGKHPVSDMIQNKTRDFLRSRGMDDDSYVFEDIQLAKYTKDGFYKHHFDGEDCSTVSCPKDQRLGTMIVYLQEPVAGGETDFPTLKTSVKPVKGNAAFFWVADPRTKQLFKETLHAGQPVKSGTKVIATQWIRAM
ncbi:prolyl 4-hydroxylase [Paramecium bursaria Chlorella virus CVG-1]|nr:prolyl 4-hydroxylase [Paramecium bursaria Chlorella virus CVG-1]